MTGAVSAIDRRARPVTLTRPGEGYYDSVGDYEAGVATVSTIRAVVQPAGGRELMDLPEGVREEAQYLIWSRTDLTKDDIITYRAEDFRVVHVWPRHEGGFTRAAMGLKATEGASS